MSKKPLKVGFDLDGVILYNPVRIFRPIASFLKPFFFKKKNRDFYFPRTALEKEFWRILHKTSFIMAPGIEDIKRLSQKRLIEPYIITARYSFLKKDFDAWLKKINAESFFAGCFYNAQNMQPHLFKGTMIEKLNLDVFVEDNLGVVERLVKIKKNPKLEIYWIYNILDRNHPYPRKFPTLKKTLQYIQSHLP